ncbi:MAG TPA: hypothetical protein VHY08_15860 [Bacillota bacterium]|nr:hypothetical protein [Bacillota bacterium]
MRKRLNRPEQLRLELGWDYLKWMVATSEGFDLYEVTTRTILAGAPRNIKAHPAIDDYFH